MYYRLQAKNIKFAFPDNKLLRRHYSRFWLDPCTDVDRFKEAIFQRMEEYLGEEPDTMPDYDEKKLINSLFSKLKTAKKKKLMPEYKFWMLFAFAGSAFERILKLRKKKASEADDS